MGNTHHNARILLGRPEDVAQAVGRLLSEGPGRCGQIVRANGATFRSEHTPAPLALSRPA